jgi:predicted nucleic-acid-binding Zn-ribbon protein
MPTPERMEVAGRLLACVVCGGDTFTKRSITMITSGLANSGFNKSVDAVTCAGCGYIHQFVLGVVKPAGSGDQPGP